MQKNPQDAENTSDIGEKKLKSIKALRDTHAQIRLEAATTGEKIEEVVERVWRAHYQGSLRGEGGEQWGYTVNSGKDVRLPQTDILPALSALQAAVAAQTAAIDKLLDTSPKGQNPEFANYMEKLRVILASGDDSAAADITSRIDYYVKRAIPGGRKGRKSRASGH